MSRVLPAYSTSSSPNSSTLTNVNKLQASSPSTVHVLYKVVVSSPVSSQGVTSNPTVVAAQSNPTSTSNHPATGLQQNIKNPTKTRNKEWTVLQMSSGESYFVKKPATSANTPASFTKAPTITGTSAQNCNNVVNKLNASLSPCVTYSNCSSISSVSRKTTAPGICNSVGLMEISRPSTLAAQENSTQGTQGSSVLRPTSAGHYGEPIAKDVDNLKMSEEEIDLSPREKRIRRLKEMVKAKEEEIEKIRQEINSNTTNASAIEVSSFATPSSFTCNSLPSVSESSSFLADKTSNQTKKLQPRKKPPSQKRSDQTFSHGSCTLPFVPDASDRLFRQLCGLEIVVDNLFKPRKTSGTNLTQDTSAS